MGVSYIGALRGWDSVPNMDFGPVWGFSSSPTSA